MKHFYALILLFTLGSYSAFAQCEEGEVEVTFELFTDDWGYEVYWELLPSGNDCGQDPIATGGNSIDVGCEGAGQEDAVGENGYESNTMINVGPFCLTDQEFYDIIFVDDYTDGGLTVYVYEDGEITNAFGGAGDPTTWTFQVGNPSIPENNVACGAFDVEVDGEGLMIDNTSALPVEGEPSPDGGSCAAFGFWCEGNATASVWAKFVAPESGSVVISTCNEGTEFDTQIALYQVVDCGDYESYTLVSSNDDVFGGCGPGAYYASTMYASCLNAGEEYYILADGWNGATGVAMLTVNTYSDGIVLDAAINNVDCPNVKGETTGGITLLANGTGAIYEATWTGPNGYTGEGMFLQDIEAGDYTVTLSNSCGETASETFTVGIPDAFDLDVSVANATCEGSSDGAVAVSMSGGSDPYEYTWTGPEGFSEIGANQSDLIPGIYSLSVSDDNNCSYNQNIEIGFDNDFSFDLGADETICQNEELFLTGPAGYDYEWQDGSENQFFIVSGPDLGTGTFPFILTASDDSGCEYTDAIFVTVDDCVGIESIDLAQVSVYPNPSSGLIYLDGLQGVNLNSIRLFDMKGSIVYVHSAAALDGTQISLDLHDLSEGMYVLELNTENASRRFRISIQ